MSAETTRTAVMPTGDELTGGHVDEFDKLGEIIGGLSAVLDRVVVVDSGAVVPAGLSAVLTGVRDHAVALVESVDEALRVIGSQLGSGDAVDGVPEVSVGGRPGRGRIRDEFPLVASRLSWQADISDAARRVAADAEVVELRRVPTDAPSLRAGGKPSEGETL